MKKTKTGYLLLYLISVVLQAASQASYVLDMSGGRVNTSNPILSGILTVQRVT
ncbi:colicin release lysis protein [Morganella morganii]|uniref:colicin release lysis protein n=1 Tax=Morganella morganii TaxID=582 RepID=UPI0032DAC99B